MSQVVFFISFYFFNSKTRIDTSKSNLILFIPNYNLIQNLIWNLQNFQNQKVKAAYARARKEKQKLVQENDNIVFPDAVYGKAEPHRDYPNPEKQSFYRKKVGVFWMSGRNLWNVSWRNKGKLECLQVRPQNFPAKSNKDQLELSWSRAVEIRTAQEEAGELAQRTRQLDKNDFK